MTTFQELKSQLELLSKKIEALEVPPDPLEQFNSKKYFNEPIKKIDSTPHECNIIFKNGLNINFVKKVKDGDYQIYIIPPETDKPEWHEYINCIEHNPNYIYMICEVSQEKCKWKYNVLQIVSCYFGQTIDRFVMNLIRIQLKLIAPRNSHLSKFSLWIPCTCNREFTDEELKEFKDEGIIRGPNGMFICQE